MGQAVLTDLSGLIPIFLFCFYDRTLDLHGELFFFQTFTVEGQTTALL